MRRVAAFGLSLVAWCAWMSMPAHATDAIIKIGLTGAQEVPGPGAPGATGTATIYIDGDTNHLCLSLTWQNVPGTPSGLHIHFAPPGSPGPVVVPFAVPVAAQNGSGSTFQCVTVANHALLENIAINPQLYYLNLHTTPTYPAGALRGQL